ncbi:MAG TPA: Nif3-like dinuclear metal center hexameric protein [Polyangiaceae bacterium]|nr:Nif3-like dinuclear metal center hexameric protein [Polyangiaceae bacterium]
MHLNDFVAALERVAPLALAEDWDNVGLLLAPSGPRSICRALFTIDLDLEVAREAVELSADIVVAYHPPIFSGCKRIVPSDVTGRTVLELLENKIAVYSPHTALDAIDGGVNDWLVAAFDSADSVAIAAKGELVGQPGHPRIGQGRRLSLATPLDFDSAVQRVKAHLGLPFVRIASPFELDHPIRTVAACPGAGGSVITQVRADLYLTGEMRHHDLLRARAMGSHVILTEHSNSERGYLRVFTRRLGEQLSEEVELLISTRDHDPLRVV